MRDIKRDIENFKSRRRARMDERHARFDFEVGDFAPDEPGDKSATHTHGNTRLPFGLCKAAGIDTTGMTPSDAWDALAGKTGVKASEAYASLKTEGDASKISKVVEKAAKKKKKKPVDEEEVAGSEEFEAPVITAAEKEIPALTPSSFKSAISAMSPYSKSVSEFAKEIEEKVMPRIKAGQAVSAGGHTYYCNGKGFETENGEERTAGFVAYRLAMHSKSGKSLSLTSGMSSKMSATSSAESEARNLFNTAMMGAKTTIKSATTHASGKGQRHIKFVLDELAKGSKIEYRVVNKDGTLGKASTAEKVGDDMYYLDNGAKTDADHLAWYLTRDLEVGEVPKLTASDLALPSKLLSAGGHTYTEETPASTKAAPSSMPHTSISDMSKGMLKSGGAITVKKTTPKKISEIPSLRDAGKTRSIWRAMHSNMFTEAQAKAVETGMKRLLDENEFCMDVNGSVLASLLTKGFRNQIQNFEDDSIEKKAGSYANVDERKQASNRMFGTPLSSASSDFEKYGFLGNPWGYGGDYGSSYGDVSIVFDKEKVQDRTTYTLGDSLGPSVNRGMVAGRCGNAPSFEGWYLSRPRAEALKRLKGGASLSDILSYTKNAYVELQFHGELTMSDVSHIVFGSEMAYRKYVTKEMQDAFDELGIKVSIR